MTYIELYEKAKRQLEKSEITLGEYEEMIKPLNREIVITCDELDELNRDMREKIDNAIKEINELSIKVVVNDYGCGAGLEKSLEILKKHIGESK